MNSLKGLQTDLPAQPGQGPVEAAGVQADGQPELQPGHVRRQGRTGLERRGDEIMVRFIGGDIDEILTQLGEG